MMADDVQDRTGWQPIETAPKGRKLLGIQSARYFVGERFEVQAFGVDVALIDRMSGKWVACTHWHDLPEPPNA
jgi:hypothetical protein